MSHFALRVGHLLSFHPRAHRHIDLLGILRKWIPTSLMHRSEPPPSAPDELANPGLCKEVEHPDAHQELDRPSLTSPSDESHWGPDETWLSLP
jgi:hypothetical protein